MSTTSKFILPHTLVVRDAAWSPDGKRIATACDDNSVRIWSAADGKLQAELQGHAREVQSVAWSPDGRRLVSGSLDKTIRVWDVDTHNHTVLPDGHTNGVYCVAWSPDGQKIASSSTDGTVCIKDSQSGVTLKTLKCNSIDGVACVAWSPNSQHVATGGHDFFNSGEEGDSAKIWDTETGEEIVKLHMMGTINSVAFSPNGRFVAFGCYYACVKIVEVASGQLKAVLQVEVGSVDGIAWSPCGKFLVSVGRSVDIWCFETKKTMRYSTIYHTMLASVAWSPCGREIVVGSYSQSAEVYTFNPVYRL